MLFAGAHEHTIDKKNRLAIPASFRDEIDPEVDGRRFYVVPGRPPTTLWIYTERRFQRLAEELGSDLLPDDDILSFKQRLFPQAFLVEPDPQGRVVIPERMLKRADLGREVVVCGVQDHLEIRRRDTWQAQDEADWQSFPEVQLKARSVLERRRQSGPPHERS